MAAGQSPRSGGPGSSRTALTDSGVFDGRRLQAPGTVVIDGGLISTGPTGTGPGPARVVDGRGGVLLPGLIDAHVHLTGIDTLEQLSGFGVTTALDMGTWPPALVESLHGREGWHRTPAALSRSRPPRAPSAALAIDALEATRRPIE